MIDWAPEAIEAAHCAMFQEPYDGTTAAMIGAGLDAAVAAQGIKDEEIIRLREENAQLLELLDDVYAQWDGDWPEELVKSVKAAISGERATGGP